MFGFAVMVSGAAIQAIRGIALYKRLPLAVVAVIHRSLESWRSRGATIRITCGLAIAVRWWPPWRWPFIFQEIAYSESRRKLDE